MFTMSNPRRILVALENMVEWQRCRMSQMTVICMTPRSTAIIMTKGLDQITWEAKDDKVKRGEKKKDKNPREKKSMNNKGAK